jgi:heat shock protein HslJ
MPGGRPFDQVSAGSRRRLSTDVRRVIGVVRWHDRPMTAEQETDAEAVLVGRTFLVTSIGGAAALETPSAVLTFGTDGRLSGRATVNRVAGAFRCDGAELICGPLATTMMAGPPEAMVQEQDVLAVLGGPVRVRRGSDDVELVAGDGRTLGLREGPAEDVLA